LSKNNSLGANSGSREPSPTVSALTGFDPGRIVQRFRGWIANRWHVHEWHDWYVFDSCGETITGPNPSFRICGQQIMMLCACGTTKRRHLRTWREARIARHLLPYKRWGIWSFSLEVPEAIAMEARQGLDRATGLDGEAATARASQEASPEPSDPRDPDNG
jgi:hypothetical protein